MPVHFSMFRGTSSATANVALTPVADSVIPALSDQLQLSKSLLLIGAGARVATVSTDSAAFLDLPAFNELGRPAVSPVFAPADAPLTLDLSMYPTPLQVGDPIAVLAALETAIDYDVGVFFADQLQCPGPEPVGWVPYTCGAPSTASITNRWQSASLTLGVRLPAGSYRVLGIRHYQDFVVAMRLLPPGQTLRPGAFSLPAGSSEEPSLPRPETSGVLCTFDAIAPPSVELYQPGAGTPAAGKGFLLLQRVGAAAGTGGCGCGKGGGCGCGGACGGR